MPGHILERTTLINSNRPVGVHNVKECPRNDEQPYAKKLDSRNVKGRQQRVLHLQGRKTIPILPRNLRYEGLLAQGRSKPLDKTRQSRAPEVHAKHTKVTKVKPAVTATLVTIKEEYQAVTKTLMIDFDLTTGEME